MSLFKNRVKQETNKRQKLIKNAITTQLSETVKEIQLGNTGGDISGDSFDVNNPVLCNVVESIFLHGLKDSLISQAKRVFADVDQRPEPSFWAPLLLISHKQIIDQISKSSQINNEIGQCRAWIRIALNDSLLSSYFCAIQQNMSAMKLYYNTFAYIRDSEVLDIAQKLVEGLEDVITFNYPTNSSLLNVWPPESLILAGIWCPTLRTCPVASGVDIAQSIQTAVSINSETSSIDSLASSVASSGLGQMLNENEALQLILSKHSSRTKSERRKAEKTEKAEKSEKTEKAEKREKNEKQEKKIEHSTPIKDESSNLQSKVIVNTEVLPLGNSLNQRLGWSFSTEEDIKDLVEGHIDKPHPYDQNKSVETTNSYNALIESYNVSNGYNEKIPALGDIISADETVNDNKDFEVADEISSEELSPVKEWKWFYLKIGTISKEIGLDNQNFECKGCKAYLGVSQKWGTCVFSGYYYCLNCMSPTKMNIPARIVHNWDFKQYSVSHQAIEFVRDIRELPTINLKILNPSIYSKVSDMSKLQKLRVQLNYLRDYLFTCHEPIIEELKTKIGGREYMYEHIHQYSISDLLEIPDGILAKCIKEVVDFGKRHVFSCCVCSQKGFICEVCNKSKVLYPFEIEHVYRCVDCNSIYHKSCLNKNKPCPKCERRRKKTNLISIVDND